MPTVAVLNMAGKEVEKIELAEGVFGIEPNVSVMNDMVKAYLANQRQGTQSALTRSEVSGGGVETEGHRPCKTGLHQSSAVDARRHRVRTEAERLHRHPQQEGEASRYEVRTLQQGSG